MNTWLNLAFIFSYPFQHDFQSMDQKFNISMSSSELKNSEGISMGTNQTVCNYTNVQLIELWN